MQAITDLEALKKLQEAEEPPIGLAEVKRARGI
jgi:hypothetical protein